MYFEICISFCFYSVFQFLNDHKLIFNIILYTEKLKTHETVKKKKNQEKWHLNCNANPRNG